MAAKNQTYANFTDLDISTLATSACELNKGGKGSSVPINGPTPWGSMGAVHVALPEMELLFPIRPDSDKTSLAEMGPFTRLNIPLSVTPDMTEFLSKAREFDTWCVERGYEAHMVADEKLAWLTDLHRQIKKMPRDMGVAVTTGRYKPFLKEGKEEEGKKYNDMINLKGDGWFSYIQELKVERLEKKNIDIVRDCVWRERLTTEPLKRGELSFFMYLPKFGTYVDRLPCLDDDKKPIVLGTSPDGKPIYKMRWVGPQDAKAHSRVTAVASFYKLYITTSFGPTVVARQLYVKAAPPQTARTQLAGHSVAVGLPPDVVLDALNDTSVPETHTEAEEAAALEREEAEFEAGGAEADDVDAPAIQPAKSAPASVPAPEEDLSAVTVERVGGKRVRATATDDESGAPAKAPRTKKARNVAADEF